MTTYLGISKKENLADVQKPHKRVHRIGRCMYMCVLVCEFSFVYTCKCKDLQTEGMQEPLGYKCPIFIFCCYQSGQDLNSRMSNEGYE